MVDELVEAVLLVIPSQRKRVSICFGGDKRDAVFVFHSC